MMAAKIVNLSAVSVTPRAFGKIGNFQIYFRFIDGLASDLDGLERPPFENGIVLC